ncbi:MAG: SufS family cysteine desulfurase [Candidatus Bilamarchaeaceae archaeon]
MIEALVNEEDFSIFKQKIDGKRLIYLDSAATTQRPKKVIDAVVEFWENKNANVARSLHKLAEEATEAYESARKKVASFIGCNEAEVVFTKNTTEGINIVARGYEKMLGSRDNITTTIMEHHSNFVPWQWLSKRKNSEFLVIDIKEDGTLNEEEYDKIDRAKIVAVTMASNVLGTINDVKKICKRAHETGAIVVVDGAQAIPHLKIDVKELDCDFFAFSGHKMLAPFGIGALYGKKELLEQIEPFLYGSEMIRKVSIEQSSWNDIPYKFEAGTPPVDAAVGLSAAIDYINEIGIEKIRKHDIELTNAAIECIERCGAKIIGPLDSKKRTALVAFSIKGVHPHDVSVILDREGIAIRSGHHCAMPLHTRLGLPEGSNRASFYIYNSQKDIEALEEGLKKVKAIFG